MPTARPWCAWLAACVVVPAVGHAQDRSGQEIVDAIVRDGPQAVAIRAELDVVRREQAARLALPNPTAAYTREGAGATDFLLIEQALPVFGIRRSLARAGVSATASAEAERDARLWLLRVEAARLVSRLQAAQVTASAAAEDLAAVQGVLRLVRIREEEGEGSRFDRLRVEQEVAEARQAAVGADVEVSQLRASLAAMLPAGWPAGPIAGALYVDREPPGPDLLQQRAAARAELRALRSSSQRTQREAEAARAARRPAPIATAGLQRAEDDDARRRGAVVGVAVSVPLFDTGAREAARWIAQGARLDAERAALERRVAAEVTAAHETMTRRRAALHAAAADSPVDDLVHAAQVAYREGDIGILAWLDALKVASRARLRAIGVQLDARLAQIALEAAVGEEIWR